MTNVERIVNDHVSVLGKKKENLLPVLQKIVKSERYLSEEAMITVSREMGLSAAEIYGVASFYSFLDIKPLGKNIIRICKTITCDMKNKDEIISALEQRLKIKLGETTRDNKFSLLTANCMGWCHKGPAMLINDRVYTELTPEKALKAIEDYL
ncbi:MAG: NAD(P)H-dependent oxidoreductase subunit E [Calditrichaceae bacterium]